MKNAKYKLETYHPTSTYSFARIGSTLVFLRTSKQRQCKAEREYSETIILKETLIFIKTRRLFEGEGRLKARAHVFISGTVQGVFFRQQTHKLAASLNVNGWVRNTHDDRVEAVFEGEINDVRKLIEFCRKGPPYARVTKVEVVWEEFAGEFRDFRVRY